ncbi:MAG: LysR family transcriptional regulator [Rhodospirillaceae bacterium]|nr:LysR family transcriptional regulator [Rhodospirillaceae bacterium]
MQSLDAMQVFVHTVEARSFTGAARRLGLSKSVVSRRLTALEARLGVRLLNRTTRSLSLTEPGQAYYERCTRILAEVEAAEAGLRSLAGGLSGLLRVAAPVSFGQRYLAPAVAEFLARHPRLTLELDLNDRFVDVVAEGIDVAVRIGRLRDSSLVARKLAPVRRVACCSPDYAARRGLPRRPEDLAGHDCLGYTNLATGEQWRFRVGERWRSVPVRGPLRVNNGDILLQAALAGLGIVALPTFVCGPAIRSGALIRVLPRFEMLEATLCAVHPQSRHPSPKVRSFLDFLAGRFGPCPTWDEGIA